MPLTEDDPVHCSYCGNKHSPRDGHIFESPMDTDEHWYSEEELEEAAKEMKHQDDLRNFADERIDE